MQLLDSCYRFVPGPMHLTMAAWEKFQDSLPQTTSPSISVNFIPAFSGCFVVVQTRQDGSWLRALHMAGASGRQSEHLLAQFCRAFGLVQT